MFSESLKSYRKEANLSQKALAELLSVSQSTVAMWESGKNSPEYNTLVKLASIFNVSIDYLSGNGTGKISKDIPVLGYVRAGIPTEAVEEILYYENILISPYDPDDYFALIIKGNSMAPRMMAGDCVIVKKCPTFISGDICVVLVGDSDATVKKVVKTDSGIMLIPLNSSYQTMFYSFEDMESIPVNIIGKVTELRAKM